MLLKKCYVGLFLVMIKVVASTDNGFTFDGTVDLDGTAEVSPTGLFRLTNGSKYATGRAFYSQPLRFKNSTNSSSSRSFSTTFVFAFINEKGSLPGHGMTFAIAPSKELGGLPAQYLGLLNFTNNGDPSNHIVAVELDTFQNMEFQDITDNHVGIDINSLESVKSAAAGYFENENGEFKNLVLDSGEPIQVWVEYDSPKKQLNVTLAPLHTSKPNIPLLSLDKDLSPTILDQMYVGFTASNGQLVRSHYVLGWSFRLDGNARLDLSRLPSLPSKEQSKKKGTVLVVGLSLTGAVIVVIFAVISILIMLRRRKQDRFTEILEDWEVQYGCHRLTYKELFVSTKGFSETELLGKGGFGKVYRGVLRGSNVEVAVKRISHNSKQGVKEFVAEIATIGQLRHPNLVRVLGYCRGKGELLLVYDYMPNGSLDMLLYDKTKVILNWNQRFKIIKDVALALTYLHEEWPVVIVHRDIKPSNVLLDGELNGKLGDFGLARCGKHQQDVQTTHVAGTLGYIAPELARIGKPNTSTDVYAFGAFCLEVACGRRPVEPKTSAKEMILVDWVYVCWIEGKILSAMDPKLDGEFKVDEEVELVLKLGLMCSHAVAEARPKMSQVLMYLRRQALLPENLNAHIKAQEGRVESDDPMLNYSAPSLTITDSLISVGR